ncbi:TIGR03086 family metal-binding protein [Actinoplanes sp. URMC 104]|uniref:TIGR03086 family metal-binding protein n=1 Tax=Actinoplanes sp. URMC 104 TaxID=3423409 RepID=UPI003F1A2A0B
MHMIETDPRPADAAAVRTTAALVGKVTDADLTRPTPCAGWDLAALLAHMTEQHLAFAAAAGATPHGASTYEQAAEAVIAAFAAEGALDRPFRLPEFDRAVPGRMAIAFHLVDYVVHGWDVARAIGVPYEPDADALALALPIARAVPDGPERLEPGAAFAPALPVPAGADPLSELLLLLGRDPVGFQR